MSGTDSHDGASEYFRAIEQTFVRLRGAPLLLSPADWQTARGWRDEGIPLDVVCDVLENVFAGVSERAPNKRISSLRYCAPAVEEAWREIRDLSAVESRLEPERIDIGRRLGELAEQLKDRHQDLEEIRASLKAIEGTAQAVEKRLEALDERMLEIAAGYLDEDESRELAERSRASVQRALGSPGAASATEGLEQRLFREAVRRRLRLPTLSLFTGSGIERSE